MPHPRAYHRAKEFLKPMLRTMVERAQARLSTNQQQIEDPISQLLRDIGPTGIVDEFKRQLEAYWRNEWPFNTPLRDGNTLAWWKVLLPHPHARVLAVGCHF
jgi:hypothetical protein